MGKSDQTNTRAISVFLHISTLDLWGRRSNPKKDPVLLFTTSSNEEHAGLVMSHLQWGAVASYQKCCYEKGILFWKLTGHFLHSYFWLPALNMTWGESVSPHTLKSSRLNASNASGRVLRTHRGLVWKFFFPTRIYQLFSTLLINRKSIKTYAISLVSSDWKWLGKAAQYAIFHKFPTIRN